MARVGTLLHSFLYGTYVGNDRFGNRYYEARNVNSGESRKRRWVLYKGKDEPSKIPAEWHCWLHYVSKQHPNEHTQVSHHDWEKGHLPNLTGTKLAYFPPGHASQGGKRDQAYGDYVAWKPSKGE